MKAYKKFLQVDEAKFEPGMSVTVTDRKHKLFGKKLKIFKGAKKDKGFNVGTDDSLMTTQVDGKYLKLDEADSQDLKKAEQEAVKTYLFHLKKRNVQSYKVWQAAATAHEKLLDDKEKESPAYKAWEKKRKEQFESMDINEAKLISKGDNNKFWRSEPSTKEATIVAMQLAGNFDQLRQLAKGIHVPGWFAGDGENNTKRLRLIQAMRELDRQQSDIEAAIKDVIRLAQ
jgi:hypothetical protein